MTQTKACARLSHTFRAAAGNRRICRFRAYVAAGFVAATGIVATTMLKLWQRLQLY